MTEKELERLVLQRLANKGLAAFIDKAQSNFLDMSLATETFFAEIVFMDASRLGEAEDVLLTIQKELQSNHIQLDFIARAAWQVLPDMVSQKQAASLTGIPIRFTQGISFVAQLKSGAQETGVSVFIAMDALDLLAERFGFRRPDPVGWVPDQGDINEKTLKTVVVSFLEQELARGGKSYWDPVRYPHLELNEAAASYLLGHSAALMELLHAVNDVFDPLAAPSFLKSLSLTSAKLKDFEQVLPELSSFFGGPYTRGQVFSTSAIDLYSHLKPAERELLKEHYFRRLERLESQSPALRDEYSALFQC
jgi:hypothetical protein